MDFQHKSVLLKETLTALAVKPDGIYIDCTLGGAGHAHEVVKQLGPHGHFIGIDQDTDALSAAGKRLSGATCQLDIIEGNFCNLGNILSELGIETVDGILFDLGVSSYQLDAAERGFSYMNDGPLDMRMDKTGKLSAAEVVNRYSEDDLYSIIKNYGEERWAKRIASFIAEARREAPLTTTGQLVRVIKKAIPAGARKNGPHPAKRTFQAIRIEVNNELGILKDAFQIAAGHLAVGGRLCIITFHSLEDRIAKQTLALMAKGCICPPQLPICVCGHKQSIRLIGHPRVASQEELADNPRARSAKLRVAEKI